MIIVLLAIISSCDGWKSIELFAHKRKRFLSQFVDLSCGIPSHYTFARIFSIIDPENFDQCVREWISQICHLMMYDLINLDGKTLCGSSHDRGEKKAIHIVNAYSPRHKVTLGSVKTPDKSNEIKGIPVLIKNLNPQGCIITIDAMGMQKGIANLIREKRAHYVLALKKNHRRFYRKVHHLFTLADEKNFEGMVYKKEEAKNYDHSRIEEREYTILPMMYLDAYKKDWRDLSAFIRVKSRRHLGDIIEEEVRYYITSLPFKKYLKMCQAVREHWSVENCLHWKLDVGLNEDDCPIYRGYADQNLSIMRKIVLKLLEEEKSTNLGVSMKRLQAALSTRYLRKVVGL
jgi:predicted transposase YbfD/YdcC